MSDPKPDGRSHWTPDDSVSACEICSRPFTFTTRRHHCRHCGRCCCSVTCLKEQQPDVIASGGVDDENVTRASSSAPFALSSDKNYMCTKCEAAALTFEHDEEIDTRLGAANDEIATLKKQLEEVKTHYEKTERELEEKYKRVLEEEKKQVKEESTAAASSMKKEVDTLKTRVTAAETRAHVSAKQVVAALSKVDAEVKKATAAAREVVQKIVEKESEGRLEVVCEWSDATAAMMMVMMMVMNRATTVTKDVDESSTPPPPPSVKKKSGGDVAAFADITNASSNNNNHCVGGQQKQQQQQQQIDLLRTQLARLVSELKRVTEIANWQSSVISEFFTENKKQALGSTKMDEQKNARFAELKEQMKRLTGHA